MDWDLLYEEEKEHYRRIARKRIDNCSYENWSVEDLARYFYEKG